MKKMIALLLTAALTLALFGCGSTPAETTSPTQTTAPAETVPETTIPETTVPETTLPQPPAESVNLNELIAGSDVELSVEGSAITLNEDGMTLELSTDSLLAYRNGYVAAVLKDIPTVIGGTVYVHEDFYNDFLCAEEAEQPSLFHGVLFFAEEILAAIDAPDASAFHLKVLEEVLLPESMGIETPNVDMLRVFSTSPLTGMPEILAQELEGLGYENPEQYTYGEYTILSGAQTLAQAGISDDTETTVAEYQRQQRAWDQQAALDDLTEQQKAFIEEKGIEMNDLPQLRKVFYGAYMEQTDEALKQALEEYYAMNLGTLQDMAEADE